MKTKPRLFLHQRLWYCLAGRDFDGHGIGFTFQDAYIDWYVRRGAA
ncbi:MAG: hypothetical protein ABJA84_00180 [Polaromonas sp.]